MQYIQDTISAISTPTGIGGISVIRVSGRDAIKIVGEIFSSKRKLENIPSHKATFGKIFDGENIIDEVVIIPFLAPRSYTGENIVEISCHGSIFITNKILELLLRKTRLANPGEFTQRAFFNNKIGLTQAEAVGDMLNAKTKFSHIAALQQFEGSLRNRIEAYLKKLTSLRTQLELEIDFLEQGLEEVDGNRILEELRELNKDFIVLSESGNEGQILREGLKVSLVGAPNVGKSSIFNKLLESERAIVTPHPGTTRDYLEEEISLKGYLIRIFDTAGLRETSDDIEKIGIKRSYDVIRESHKILFIIDGDENTSEYEKLCKIVDSTKIIKIISKSDLLSEEDIIAFRNINYIPCSTISKNGLDQLKEVLLQDIEISEDQIQSGILTNTRQIAAVNKAIESTKKAIKSIEQNMGFEFTAFDLKEASSSLEEIIGKVTTDDILNEIFENFCIGK